MRTKQKRDLYWTDFIGKAKKMQSENRFHKRKHHSTTIASSQGPQMLLKRKRGAMKRKATTKAYRPFAYFFIDCMRVSRKGQRRRIASEAPRKAKRAAKLSVSSASPVQSDSTVVRKSFDRSEFCGREKSIHAGITNYKIYKLLLISAQQRYSSLDSFFEKGNQHAPPHRKSSHERGPQAEQQHCTRHASESMEVGVEP